MSGDIIDRIDELVDEQLSAYGQRSGYDYNRAEQRCPHCHRDWHGLAITERLEQMQREYRAMDPRDGECDYATSAIVGDYRYADDDSPVLCPGSTFIGPRRPTRSEQARMQMADANRRAATGVAHIRMHIDSNLDDFRRRYAELWTAATRDMPDFNPGGWFNLGRVEAGSIRFTPDDSYQEAFAHARSPWVVFRDEAAADLTITTQRWLDGDPPPTPEPEPEPPANPERWQHLPPLPRPATRPPMWAVRADGRRR